MKILFIAYYYEPYPEVGAQRVSYWAKNLHKIAPDWDVFVVTATEDARSESDVSVTILKNNIKGLWSYIFKTDAGASWAYALKRWFKNNDCVYDVVLFTGGPFLHFRIVNWLKKKFNSKVIFDFRDPMSRDPRFKPVKLSLILKNKVMSIIELNFVKKADLILTVNRWCIPLIEGIDHKKSMIIENGFDENVLYKASISDEKQLVDSNKIHLAYAGKIYYGMNPYPFLRAMKNQKIFKNNIELIYIGDRNEYLMPFESEEWLKQMGRKSYFETQIFLKSCDYGILFLEKELTHSFQTKVFDYLGHGLPFIVFSDERLENCALFEIASQYKNIYVVRNNEKDIADFLIKIAAMPKPQKAEPPYQYSRKAGLNKLVSVINNLHSAGRSRQ
jgi:hypothetical protein